MSPCHLRAAGHKGPECAVRQGAHTCRARIESMRISGQRYVVIDSLDQVRGEGEWGIRRCLWKIASSLALCDLRSGCQAAKKVDLEYFDFV